MWGRAPAIGPIKLEKAVVDPELPVARTATMSVNPTSFLPGLWLRVWTPRRIRQWRPIVSQRYQPYEYLSDPVVDHDPLEATRRPPCVASPVTAGLFVRIGPDAAPAEPIVTSPATRAKTSPATASSTCGGRKRVRLSECRATAGDRGRQPTADGNEAPISHRAGHHCLHARHACISFGIENDAPGFVR